MEGFEGYSSYINTPKALDPQYRTTSDLFKLTYKQAAADFREVCTSAHKNRGAAGLLEETPDIIEALMFEVLLALSKEFGKRLVWLQNWRTYAEEQRAFVTQVYLMEFVGKIGPFAVIAFYFVPEWGTLTPENCETEGWDASFGFGEYSLSCLQAGHLSYSLRLQMMESAAVAPFVIAQLLNLCVKIGIPKGLTHWMEMGWGKPYVSRQRGWDEESFASGYNSEIPSETKSEFEKNSSTQTGGATIDQDEGGAGIKQDNLTPIVPNGPESAAASVPVDATTINIQPQTPEREAHSARNVNPTVGGCGEHHTVSSRRLAKLKLRREKGKHCCFCSLKAPCFCFCLRNRKFKCGFWPLMREKVPDHGQRANTPHGKAWERKNSVKKLSTAEKPRRTGCCWFPLSPGSCWVFWEWIRRILICACVLEEDDVGDCDNYVWCANGRIEEIHGIRYSLIL